MNAAVTVDERRPPRSELVETVQHISTHVVRPAAPGVDSSARFPHEAIDALKSERLLAAYVPVEYGGWGCTVSELVAMTSTLSQSCAATGMIWAMHQIQVACLVHHTLSAPFFRQYAQDLANNQPLIASITSEVGVGGDIRCSIAAIDQRDGGFTLDKRATTISYGEYAGGFLATARRSKDAASNDQVLVLLHRQDMNLTKTSEWQTLGMRGTCSPGFDVSSAIRPDQILPLPFADIAAQTMVPISHILWSACWLGIATDAFDRARKYERAKARQQVAEMQANVRLAEAADILQLMRANISESMREYEFLLQHRERDNESFSNMGFVIRMNQLKTTSSQLALEVVDRALKICGIAGYKEDSAYSVARHLRDVYSASLMIGNDRLHRTNAALLLVHKDG